MATENFFVKAKRYQKTHPRTSWQDCIKAVSGKRKAATKKKPAAKRKAVAKKATKGTIGRVKRSSPAKSAKKLKIKIKPGKKGGGTFTISGISLDKTRQELSHMRSLETLRDRHKMLLKEKGLSAGEKANIRRELVRYNNAIKTAKQHITALKRSI